MCYSQSSHPLDRVCAPKQFTVRLKNLAGFETLQKIQAFKKPLNKDYKVRKRYQIMYQRHTISNFLYVLPPISGPERNRSRSGGLASRLLATFYWTKPRLSHPKEGSWGKHGLYPSLPYRAFARILERSIHNNAISQSPSFCSAIYFAGDDCLDDNLSVRHEHRQRLFRSTSDMEPPRWLNQRARPPRPWPCALYKS